MVFTRLCRYALNDVFGRPRNTVGTWLQCGDGYYYRQQSLTWTPGAVKTVLFISRERVRSENVLKTLCRALRSLVNWKGEASNSEPPLVKKIRGATRQVVILLFILLLLTFWCVLLFWIATICTI